MTPVCNSSATSRALTNEGVDASLFTNAGRDVEIGEEQMVRENPVG